MAKLTGYSLEVTYRLNLRNPRNTQVAPAEAELVNTLIRIIGREPDQFIYAARDKRREATWILRSSRGARTAENLIKRLRSNYRKMDLQTTVRYISRNTDESLDEGKKYLITPGQYKALMREGAARTCLECHQCIPKYKGRYPKNCAGCGGNVGNPIEDSVDSNTTDVVKLAVEGILSGKPVDEALHDILEMSYSKYRTRKGIKRVGVGALLGTPLLATIPGAAVGGIYHATRGDKDKADWEEKYGKRNSTPAHKLKARRSHSKST